MKDSHTHTNHDHHHNHAELQGKRLLWVSLLNFSITLVQIIGGLLSNSLSLLSDAMHNLGDSSAIFIAFLAGKRSRKDADNKHTFGYKRIEILVAFFNALVLVAICLFLFYEAVHRFINPEPIKGKMMLIVATFGLLANFISILVLNKDKDHNLNVKAAYLHLMGDTLSSVAVIIGGLAIWKFEIFWLDPLITIFVGIYIIYHTWGVVIQTVDILMQTTPSNINITELKQEIEKNKSIDNIHHIHAWSLDDTKIHFEAHVNLKNNISMLEMMKIKDSTETVIREKYKVDHITLQMGYNCCEGDQHLLCK